MSKLTLNLNGKQNYRCGEEIKGSISWDLENSFETIVIRLFWYTSGKGTRDIGIEKEIIVESQNLSDTRAFNFIAPSSVYSFSGRLISIVWAIEAIVSDNGETALEHIEISPTGNEIVIEQKKE